MTVLLLLSAAVALVVVFALLMLRLFTHLAAFIRKPSIVSTTNVVFTGALCLLASYGLDRTVEKLKDLL